MYEQTDRRVVSTRQKVVGITSVKLCHSLLLGVLCDSQEVFLFYQQSLRPFFSDSRPLTRQAVGIFCFDEHGHQHMCIEKLRNRKRVLTFWHISCQGKNKLRCFSGSCFVSQVHARFMCVYTLVCARCLCGGFSD
jgi:hypothetical protein